MGRWEPLTTAVSAARIGGPSISPIWWIPTEMIRHQAWAAVGDSPKLDAHVFPRRDEAVREIHISGVCGVATWQCDGAAGEICDATADHGGESAEAISQCAAIRRWPGGRVEGGPVQSRLLERPRHEGWAARQSHFASPLVLLALQSGCGAGPAHPSKGGGHFCPRVSDISRRPGVWTNTK